MSDLFSSVPELRMRRLLFVLDVVDEILVHSFVVALNLVVADLVEPEAGLVPHHSAHPLRNVLGVVFVVVKRLLQLVRPLGVHCSLGDLDTASVKSQLKARRDSLFAFFVEGILVGVPEHPVVVKDQAVDGLFLYDGFAHHFKSVLRNCFQDQAQILLSVVL